MKSPLEFFPEQDYNYKSSDRENSDLIIRIKKSLSNQESDKVSEENRYMLEAYKASLVDKVSACTGFYDGEVSAFKKKDFINSSHCTGTKLVRIPPRIGHKSYYEIMEKNGESHNVIEDAASLSFIKDPETGKFLMTLPLYGGAKLCSPIEECISNRIVSIDSQVSFEPFNTTFKREAKIFRCSDFSSLDMIRMHDYSFSQTDYNTIHDFRENSDYSLTTQEFLDQCKDSDNKRYGKNSIICVSLRNFNSSFVMPGRIIFKLDELESGLKNGDPRFRDIIPQELKDAFPKQPLSSNCIREIFLDELTTMYMYRYAGIRFDEIMSRIANECRVFVTHEVMQNYFKNFIPKFSQNCKVFVIEPDQQYKYPSDKYSISSGINPIYTRFILADKF